MSSSAKPQQAQPPGPDPLRTVAEAADRLAGLPLEEHADVYERIHMRLRDALADIDDA